MKQGLKTFLFLGAGLFLIFHFSLLLIHALPLKGEKKRVQYWSDYYAYPYFQQSWSLFAPPPEENYKLFVEYENLGNKKQDLILDILSKHRDNVLKGREAVYLSICNSIHFFEKNSSDKHPLNGPIENNLYWSILEHQVIRYINSTHQLHLSEIKMALHCNNVLTGQKRVYYNTTFAQKSFPKK
jgi:hypothetical protein